MMSKYLSHKLTILYTILIIMVLYIHSYFKEGEQYPVVLFIQRFWGLGICSVANCLFFCMSGYLFARNLQNLRQVWEKQKKRFRSMLPPYILWNLIFVLWYIVLEMLPGLSSFNNSGALASSLFNQPIGDVLYDLFIKPAAFQMWFLRDLISMMFLTPLMWWLSRKSLIVSAVVILAVIPLWGWVVYYWLGVIIAVKDINVEYSSARSKSVAICFTIVLIYALYLGSGGNWIPYINIFVGISGVYAIWGGYDIIMRGATPVDKGIWKYFCGFSFFVYCFHEPAFNIIKKISVICLGTNQISLIILYFVNPLIMLWIAVLVARVLQHICPPVYRILTGGR